MFWSIINKSFVYCFYFDRDEKILKMQEIMEGGNLCLKQCETTTNEKEPLYVRVMRKKYKCILLWLFSIDSVSQLFYIIIDKFDNKF